MSGIQHPECNKSAVSQMWKDHNLTSENVEVALSSLKKIEQVDNLSLDKSPGDLFSIFNIPGCSDSENLLLNSATPPPEVEPHLNNMAQMQDALNNIQTKLNLFFNFEKDTKSLIEKIKFLRFLTQEDKEELMGALERSLESPTYWRGYLEGIDKAWGLKTFKQHQAFMESVSTFRSELLNSLAIFREGLDKVEVYGGNLKAMQSQLVTTVGKVAEIATKMSITSPVLSECPIKILGTQATVSTHVTGNKPNPLLNGTKVKLMETLEEQISLERIQRLKRAHEMYVETDSSSILAGLRLILPERLRNQYSDKLIISSKGEALYQQLLVTTSKSNYNALMKMILLEVE